MSNLDIGFAVHATLPAALWASAKRTFRTWRYARSIGADPTHWWGVYEGGTENCLASVGPLPGAEERARKIADAIEAEDTFEVLRNPDGPEAATQLEAMQAVLANVEATLKRTDMTERARLAVIEQFVTARASLDRQGK